MRFALAIALALAAVPAAAQDDIAYAPVTVGGEAAVVLHRPDTSAGRRLEFRSVTLFPGRGLNLFQITANIPGKGETSLMLSPPVDEAAAVLTGTGDDKWGNRSHSFGGAFLVPYANLINGEVAPDGQTLVTVWRGRRLTLPANWQGKLASTPRRALHGLILDRRMDDVETHQIRDGAELTAVLHAGDFGGHWPSSTDLHFSVSLTRGAVDVQIRAVNVGNEDTPVAIGWHPYFAIPSGLRAQARLHLPAATVMAAHDAIPTGALLPVTGTAFDFRAEDGVAMGAADYNNNFSSFRRGAGGIEARISDSAARYGLRVQALSPGIKTVQVYAPAAKPFIAVEPEYNFPDPFSPVWTRDSGMVVLKPGQSTTWHVRLELFTPK